MKAPKADAIRKSLQAGMTLKKAAEHAGATLRYARQVAMSLGYTGLRYEATRARRARNDALRRAIVDGYTQGRLPAEIAAQHGSTAGSVRVMAHRLGVSHQGEAIADFRRGYAVPETHAAEYKSLQLKTGLRAIEVARLLGIAP